MDGDWENFIRGINRTALELERLPHLIDPELERPGSVEDNRMRSKHAERRDAFYEANPRESRLTPLERRRIAQLSQERNEKNQRATQYRAARRTYLERKTA